MVDLAPQATAPAEAAARPSARRYYVLALLTIVYMLGLVFRPQRQWLRMGPDSIAVLILYTLGIAGLAFIPT